MANQPDNNSYGLTPKEARMLGIQQEGTADIKDVELETSIIRRVRSMGGDHVHVTVKAGKVTLTGMADDFESKRDIVHYVQSLPGVFKLVNMIKVIPGDTGRPGRGGS
jgi:hypothetical protein